MSTHPAQSKFDEQYITSTEIMRVVGVSRTALLSARKCGTLPEAIVVNDGQLYIWERKPLQPYLDAWALVLQRRRSAVPA